MECWSQTCSEWRIRVRRPLLGARGRAGPILSRRAAFGSPRRRGVGGSYRSLLAFKTLIMFSY